MTAPEVVSSRKLFERRPDFHKSGYDGRNQLEERPRRPAPGVRAKPRRGRNAGGCGVGGPRRVAGQPGEAAGRTCMESARRTPAVQPIRDAGLRKIEAA